MTRKIGKTADSIFAPTLPTPAPVAAPAMPLTVEMESRTKVTVVLYDRQIAQLDHLCADMRSKTKSAISRTDVIRALIDALTESGLDVTEATSENEIKSLILNRMRG